MNSSLEFSILAGKTSDLPTRPLIRPFHWAKHPAGRLQPLFLPHFLPLQYAGLSLFIQKLRLPGRPSLAGDPLYNYGKFHFAPPYPQFFTRHHSSCRFHSGSVDMHLASGNCLCCHGTGFKKPRCPKPFIDSYLFFCHFIY